MHPDRASDHDLRVAVIVPTVSQAEHLRACLAALRHTQLPAGWTLDVFVVLNGATAAVRDVARRAADLRIVESAVNRGFAGGCQLGVQATDAPWLAFLNDDVTVQPGWLAPLLDTLMTVPAAGAVAPRILAGDGTVQEIGSVIWRDGTTRPLGRGLPATSMRWRWRRRVDYASACALLVRRAAWEAVGGFDEGYHPAYYEDVDFCLGLEAAGYEVWVDPRADVVHAESSSSTSDYKHFLFARHHARLAARWPERLACRVPPPTMPDAIARAESAAVARLRGDGTRVLVVDDRTPQHGLGSGFDRMADTVLDLAAAGAQVICVATETGPAFSPTLAAAGIEVMDGLSDEGLSSALEACEVAIVSRPNNAVRVRRALAAVAPARAPLVVYDAEALYHRRVSRQAALEHGAAATVLAAQAAAWREIEETIAAHVHGVLCVSEDEAAFFRAQGQARVEVHTPWLRQAAPTSPSLDGRADVGFVAGWLAGARSPNGDALEWFAGEVLPHIVREVPWVRVRVTGTLPTSLRRLEGLHLRSDGFVPDLAAFYAGLRVAVAPLRFGAGVKLKTLEAVQYGVPVVATAIGAEGLDQLHGGAVVVADDPRAFAAAVVTRLLDVEAWRTHRGAIDAVVERIPRRRAWGPWLTALRKDASGVGRPL